LIGIEASFYTLVSLVQRGFSSVCGFVLIFGGDKYGRR
jgi:hypothetical protein